jgi:hypothetical protein
MVWTANGSIEKDVVSAALRISPASVTLPNAETRGSGRPGHDPDPNAIAPIAIAPIIEQFAR